jgi:integrase/recombinase XerD
MALIAIGETPKPLFPNRDLNAKTIRQSVITNLLKQKKDLRAVHVFAGHKKPGSQNGTDKPASRN